MLPGFFRGKTQEMMPAAYEPPWKETQKLTSGSRRSDSPSSHDANLSDLEDSRFSSAASHRNSAQVRRKPSDIGIYDSNHNPGNFIMVNHSASLNTYEGVLLGNPRLFRTFVNPIGPDVPSEQDRFLRPQREHEESATIPQPPGKRKKTIWTRDGIRRRLGLKVR
jgi:hypothetical protein